MRNLLGLVCLPFALILVVLGLIVLQIKIFWEIINEPNYSLD